MNQQNNNNQEKQLYFDYRCEGCCKKFRLPTDSMAKDPYPIKPGTPVEERMITCLECRKALDKEFQSVMKGWN